MIISVASWFGINTQEALDQVSEFIKASEVDPGIWGTLTGNCWQSSEGKLVNCRLIYLFLVCASKKEQ